MTEELKPCPFCGETAIFVVSTYGGTHCGDCANCCAQGPAEQTEAEAIAEWNTRAPVRVKPLVWDEKYEGTARAEYRRRHFYECHSLAPQGWICHETIQGVGYRIGEFFKTVEAAKAAAQADYERRILDALE